MFPNVRLMIVAILAAVAGIGCGLGLFATFRVNHEPLARLAEGSPPLQLAFDNRALGSDARAPVEARLPVNGAGKSITDRVIIATPSPTPSPTPEQSEADSAIARDSSVQQEPAGAAAADQSNTASLALAVPAEPSSVMPQAPSQQETAAALPDQQPAAAAAAATSPATEQTAAVNAATEDQQPAAKPTKSEASKAAKPAARTARAALARRAGKAVRARRAVAKVAAQPTYQYAQPSYAQPTYAQPTYTWVDGAAQASQQVNRQIKRHRAAKKMTPAAAQPNASAATAGLSGTQ